MRMLQKLFKDKPYLAWYVANPENLSEKSMLEHILNYGDWDEYLLAEKSLGIGKVKHLFEQMKSQRRINLRPETVNYFTNYFARYA